MATTFLNRSDSPLQQLDWDHLDATVVDVARRMLVGRRFLHLFGPLGAGIQDVDYDVFTGTDPAKVAAFGEDETSVVRAHRRVHENIPLIYKDFILYWRDIETSRQMGTPLDVSAAAAAASYVAQREDALIFDGVEDGECHHDGLLEANGRNTLASRDWSEAGCGFQDVVDARAKLLAGGFYGPYAVVVNPVAFSQLHRVYASSGILEINHVRDIATSGVFQSSAIPATLPGVVLSTGIQNFDLAIGQDLVTAYLGGANLNHPFRILESLVLRIKRPGAICTLEPPGYAGERAAAGSSSRSEPR